MPPKHARRTARKAKRESKPSKTKPSEPESSIKTLRLPESSAEFPPRVWLPIRRLPRIKYLSFFFFVASYPFIVAACYKKYPKHRRGILGAHGFLLLLILGASININSFTLSRSWSDFVNLLIQTNSVLAVLITPKPYISAARSLKSLALQIQALQDPSNVSALVPSYLVSYVQKAIDIPIWIKALAYPGVYGSTYMAKSINGQAVYSLLIVSPIIIVILTVLILIKCAGCTAGRWKQLFSRLPCICKKASIIKTHKRNSSDPPNP